MTSSIADRSVRCKREVSNFDGYGRNRRLYTLIPVKHWEVEAITLGRSVLRRSKRNWTNVSTGRSEKLRQGMAEYGATNPPQEKLVFHHEAHSRNATYVRVYPPCYAAVNTKHLVQAL